MLIALFALIQDQAAVAEAARKTEALNSYRFAVEFDVQGFGDRGGRGSPRIEGTYLKEEGLHVRIGEHLEVARKGKCTAYAGSDRNWSIVKDEPPPEGEGGRDRRDFQKRMIRNMRAPHEELHGIDARFKEVKKEGEKGRIDGQDCDVYSGELTPEGAKELVPNRGMIGRMEKLELQGTARLWVNDRGIIVSARIVVEATGEFRERPFNVTFSRTILLSQIDEARSEIPEEARKLLDSETAEK
jgi:hypothetical protein